MKGLYIKLIAALGLIAVVSSIAQAESRLTLHDALTAAIEHQSYVSSQNITEISTDKSFADWIDGPPSVSLMRLESQQDLGTTESEISLNLPVKSPFLRQVEQTLKSKVEHVRKSAELQYALYLSGLIRNVLWDIELEKVRLKTLQSKQAMLSELSQQYATMAKAQAIPQYLSLIVQNELNQQKIAFAQHKQNIKTLTNTYFRLTGLYILPDNIVEKHLNDTSYSISLHPDIQALDALFESTQQQMLSAGIQATPWQVQLTGRKVDTTNYTENQLGIGIEVPMTMDKNLSFVQQSEMLKIKTEYSISKQKLLLALSEEKAQLQQEYDFLLQKQALLNDGLFTLNSLVQTMNELRAANAPNQEFFIRTLLAAVDSQQDAKLNRLYIQRQIALIKQASGITL